MENAGTCIQTLPIIFLSFAVQKQIICGILWTVVKSLPLYSHSQLNPRWLRQIKKIGETRQFKYVSGLWNLLREEHLIDLERICSAVHYAVRQGCKDVDFGDVGGVYLKRSYFPETRKTEELKKPSMNGYVVVIFLFLVCGLVGYLACFIFEKCFSTCISCTWNSHYYYTIIKVTKRWVGQWIWSNTSNAIIVLILKIIIFLYVWFYISLSCIYIYIMWLDQYPLAT